MSDGMDAVQELAGILNANYGAPIVFGTVISTEAFEESELVDVALLDGNVTKAIAWTQAVIKVGDDVVLGHVEGSDSVLYAILSINAPALGMDPMTRDASPFITLWGGKPLRPSIVPAAEGDLYYFAETMQTTLLNLESYQHMMVDVRFTFPPLTSAVRYWLYGWSPLIAPEELGSVDPDFKLMIGATLQSEDGRHLRTTFNINAPGALGEFLFDATEANFCLVMERITSGTVRGSAIGKIRSAQIMFLQDLEMEDMRIQTTSACRFSSIDPEIVTVSFTATTDVSINQWWFDMRTRCSVDGVVMG